MTALAVQADVVTALGRTLTAAEVTALTGALAKASSVVRAVTGRRYEAGTFTVKRRVRCAAVQLDEPSTVTAVKRVSTAGTETTLTGWVLRGDTVYGINCAGWVEVTYTVTAPTPPAVLPPAEVVEVAARIAGRILTTFAPEGAESWTVTRGPFTESATFSDATDSATPTVSDLQILGRYALRREGPLTSL